MEAPASRNAPCPCGSGKRYKECHGALGAPASPAASAATDSIPQRMQQALIAQQRGDLVQAIALYQSVVAAEPGNFDALHMLGVAHYQAGNNGSALTYVEMALQLRPDVEAAQHNLYLIRQAIGFLPAAAEELSAQALARVARFLADPATSVEALRLARELHVVFACASGDEGPVRAALRLIEDIGHRATTLWAKPGSEFERRIGRIVHRYDAASGEFPRGGAMLCVGVEQSLMAWLMQSRPQRVALIAASGASNRLLLRRIRELAEEGRRTLHLFYAGADKRSRRIAPGLELASR